MGKDRKDRQKVGKQRDKDIRDSPDPSSTGGSAAGTPTSRSRFRGLLDRFSKRKTKAAKLKESEQNKTDEVRFHKEGDAAENDKGAENLAAAMKAVYSDPGSNRSNTVAEDTSRQHEAPTATAVNVIDLASEPTPTESKDLLWSTSVSCEHITGNTIPGLTHDEERTIDTGRGNQSKPNEASGCEQASAENLIDCQTRRSRRSKRNEKKMAVPDTKQTIINSERKYSSVIATEQPSREVVAQQSASLTGTNLSDSKFPVSSAGRDVSASTATPDFDFHGQGTPVVHYHLMIQNCEGLNIYVNSNDGAILEPWALPNEQADPQTRLSWVQANAGSDVSHYGLAKTSIGVESASDCLHPSVSSGLQNMVKRSSPHIDRKLKYPWHSVKKSPTSESGFGVRTASPNAKQTHPGVIQPVLKSASRDKIPTERNITEVPTKPKKERKSERRRRNVNSEKVPAKPTFPPPPLPENIRLTSSVNVRESKITEDKSSQVSPTPTLERAKAPLPVRTDPSAKKIAYVAPCPRRETNHESQSQPHLLSAIPTEQHLSQVPPLNDLAAPLPSPSPTGMEITFSSMQQAVPVHWIPDFWNADSGFPQDADDVSSVTTDNLLQDFGDGGAALEHLQNSVTTPEHGIPSLPSSPLSTHGTPAVARQPHGVLVADDIMTDRGRNRRREPNARPSCRRVEFRREIRAGSADRETSALSSLDALPPGTNSFRRHQSLHERRHGDLSGVTGLTTRRFHQLRREIARVPGVLILQAYEGRLRVLLSRDRPNVQSVLAFMESNGIPRHLFQCEILPWRYRQGHSSSPRS